MVVIIAVSVVVLLALFFLNWELTVIALLPLVFAFICTLGTLNLMGPSAGYTVFDACDRNPRHGD